MKLLNLIGISFFVSAIIGCNNLNDDKKNEVETPKAQEIVKRIIITKQYNKVPDGKIWVLQCDTPTIIQIGYGVMNSGSLCNALFCSKPRMVYGIKKGNFYHHEGHGIIFENLKKVPYTNNYTYQITPISIVDNHFAPAELRDKNIEDVGVKSIIFKSGETVYVDDCLESIELIEKNTP